MIPHLRLTGLLALALVTTIGCDIAQNAGPILYRESERATTELASKPKLRETIQTALVNTFGPDLQHMKVPESLGLREGGIYLADQTRIGEKLEPVTESVAGKGQVPIKGGYALYRTHCLHCHGVSGAGDGPTAAFLFPRPRDYRPGIFKFTSTNPTNAKPSRDDLRKTLLYGLHGTSMPGFEATMSLTEIDQVIDYLTFLSIRGETERTLIEEATSADDKDATSTLDAEFVTGAVETVASSWKEAEQNVVQPDTRRVASTPESIDRGRALYLGIDASGKKLECAGCHGVSGKGNGLAFIDQGIFDDVVFRQYSFDEATARTYRAQQERAGGHGTKPSNPDPAAVGTFLVDNPAILNVLRKDHNLLGLEVTDPQLAYLIKNDLPKVADAAVKLLPDLADPGFRGYLVNRYELWTKGSMDYWNNPLRPANLLNGVYKGGRRPLDLYWRIAKGINGAKMPAHSNILSNDQIWDIINFVLALPDQPELLKDAVPSASHETKTASASLASDPGKR